MAIRPAPKVKAKAKPKPTAGRPVVRGLSGGSAGGEWQEYGEVRRRASVTLDANGNGSVDFDVQHANQRWEFDSIVLTTNQAQTAPPYPQVTVYVGGKQVGVSVGATWLGNQTTLTGRIAIGACDTMTVQFSGGVAGSVATATPEGTGYLWR